MLDLVFQRQFVVAVLRHSVACLLGLMFELKHAVLFGAALLLHLKAQNLDGVRLSHL